MTDDRKTEQASDSGCESRLPRVAEVEGDHLGQRSDVAPTQQRASLPRGAVGRRLAITCLTLLVLTSLPDYWLGHGDDRLEFVVYGLGFASPWMWWTFLYATVALLACRDRIRLAVLLVGAGVLTLCCGIRVWLLDDSEAFSFMVMAPFAAALIASPILVASLALQWRVTHQSDVSTPRPTSITSYLILTATIAVMIAVFPFIPEADRNLWTEDRFRLLWIFLTPVLASMLILVISVRILLGQRHLRSFVSIVRLAGLFVLGSVISPVSPAYAATVLDADPREMVLLGIFAISWSAMYLFGCTAFGLVLRGLGYRLR
ncbi:MAG: hypothetical protein AAFU85_00745 [Planctomycetota bacterium]